MNEYGFPQAFECSHTGCGGKTEVAKNRAAGWLLTRKTSHKAPPVSLVPGQGGRETPFGDNSKSFWTASATKQNQNCSSS